MTLPVSPIEIADVELEKYKERKFRLIKSLKDQSLRLSFSSFSKFADTPNKFIEYKLQKKKPTDAMRLGRLLDCFLTDESNFDKHFVIMDKPAPKSPMAISFCESLAEGENIEVAFLNAGYKSTKDNLKSALSKKKDLQWYLDFLEQSSGKLIVTPEEVKNEKFLAYRLRTNRASRKILNRVTDTQVETKWRYEGFDWLGYKDFSGEGMTADLKRMGQTVQPRKVRYTIRDKRYHWQVSMYDKKQYDDCYIIAIDNSGEICVHELTENDIRRAWAEMDKTMKDFKRWIHLEDWDASYDFFTRSGFYDYGI